MVEKENDVVVVKVGENAIVAIKPGNKTSEYAMAKSAGWRAWVGILIGAIIAIGPMVLPALQDNALAASIVGGLIMVASKMSAAFPQTAFIKGRGEIKVKAVVAAEALNDKIEPEL